MQSLHKSLTFIINIRIFLAITLSKRFIINIPTLLFQAVLSIRSYRQKNGKRLKTRTPQNDTVCFFTIGYEGNSFENYLNRLIKNNVKLLCDVRRNPLSRKYGFSKKTLSHTLAELNIDYMHLPELGIISDKRQALESKADFQRLFAEYEQTTLKENPQALEKLLRLLEEKKRIAITCFESCQTMCHRGRVATALTNLPNWNYPVQHL